MQSVTLVLREDHVCPVEECHVVEARVRLVRLVEEPQRALVALRVLPEFLDAAEAAVVGSGLAASEVSPVSAK